MMNPKYNQSEYLRFNISNFDNISEIENTINIIEENL